MTYDLLFALLVFCASMTFSPGPNNVMLVASGANFGLRRSLPHMAGVAFGLPMMAIPVGLGIMQVFDRWPWTETALLIVSFAYLLRLAWKIAHATPAADPENAASKPLSFWQAAGFQWVNPKAWAMILGAITLFAAGRDLPSILIVAACFSLAGMGSTTTWVTLGTALRRLLSDPAKLRLFNWGMASLLVLSMIPVLRG